ncbi:hypothetical protein H633G_10493 [Metarhizium anisopliae BRIP 53284]|nr:hypothetical protein H633G_10493 [Metarhizium anisopliae BRIP 53284]
MASTAAATASPCRPAPPRAQVLCRSPWSSRPLLLSSMALWMVPAQTAYNASSTRTWPSPIRHSAVTVSQRRVARNSTGHASTNASEKVKSATTHGVSRHRLTRQSL